MFLSDEEKNFLKILHLCFASTSDIDVKDRKVVTNFCGISSTTVGPLTFWITILALMTKPHISCIELMLIQNSLK